MRKDILIPFSGGLDSTYLIQKALEASTDNHVYLIKFEIGNNITQTKMENKARDIIYNYFKERYGNRVEFNRAQMKVDIKVGDLYSATLIQPVLWIMGCSIFSSSIDEIHLGYVMGDDAISYLPEIKRLYNAYKPFIHTYVRRPVLKFPLIKIKKTHIWNMIDDKLKKMISTCENPLIHDDVLSHCGKCKSCKTMINNIGLDVFNEYFTINESEVEENDVEKQIKLERANISVNEKEPIKPNIVGI